MTIIFIIIFAIVYLIINWFIITRNDRPYIKLKQLIELYNDAPNKWMFEDAYVAYCPEGYYTYASATKFKLNLIDYYPYRYWVYKINKQRQKDKVQEVYNEIKEANKK